MKKRTLAEIKAQLPKWRQMEENNQHTWLLHIIACFFFDYGLATTPENWPLCDMIQQMNDFQEKAGYLSAEMYQARNFLGKELFRRIAEIYGQEVVKMFPF